jgi:hypothetical protein
MTSVPTVVSIFAAMAANFMRTRFVDIVGS